MKTPEDDDVLRTRNDAQRFVVRLRRVLRRRANDATRGRFPVPRRADDQIQRLRFEADVDVGNEISGKV
jgi:hypothetical protein